jgi:transposase
MPQLHKKFSDSQVKELFDRYVRKYIERPYLQEILGIGKARFFALLRRYRKNPQAFSIQYQRAEPSRTIAPDVEKNILKELSLEKRLIQDKNVPLRSYNYSYIKGRLQDTYAQEVSLSTVIRRAKEHGFYLQKPKRTAHDREVLTHYAGELIQHDASIHLFAPAAEQKWILITSLDDFSRKLLYAHLFDHETTWGHIQALQTVFLRDGLPMTYYVDSHSIFRFVRGRDDIHYQHHLQTDETNPQWKQVLEDCGVKVIYALSPQAKGKIERPYGWLQDHLVRTFVRENVTSVHQAQPILAHELHRYNNRQVHSTTLEIPSIRFQKALRAGQSLFRPFRVMPPYQNVKDIFCLRLARTADAYRRVSLHTLQLKINGVNPGDLLNLRLYPLNAAVSELRCWRRHTLLDVITVKNADLKGVQF